MSICLGLRSLIHPHVSASMAVHVNYLSTLTYFPLYPILPDELQHVSDIFYYHSNNNLSGEIPSKVCEMEKLYLSGYFGCFSSSGFICIGACERRSPGCFHLTQDEDWKTGYFWNSLKVNVSVPFSFEVTMHAGSNNDIGADGLVFVLQDIINSLVGNYRIQ